MTRLTWLIPLLLVGCSKSTPPPDPTPELTPAPIAKTAPAPPTTTTPTPPQDQAETPPQDKADHEREPGKREHRERKGD